MNFQIIVLPGHAAHTQLSMGQCTCVTAHHIDIPIQDFVANGRPAPRQILAVRPGFNERLRLAGYVYAPKLASAAPLLNLASLALTAEQQPLAIKQQHNAPPLGRTLFSGLHLPSAVSAAVGGSITPTKRKALGDLLTPSPSPAKRIKNSPSYSPPEKYAHLNGIADILVKDLICVFIGLNPGVMTATMGHSYAHPSNRFWKLLHSSGCTTYLMKPDEDRALPQLFGLGNTNIVDRPTRNGAELSRLEMDQNVHILSAKIRHYSPEAVCIVGKSIWDSIYRVRFNQAVKKEEFRYGWQAGKWEGARVFVATSTSGLAAATNGEEKERIWRELGNWVKERREASAQAAVVKEEAERELVAEVKRGMQGNGKKVIVGQGVVRRGRVQQRILLDEGMVVQERVVVHQR